MITDTSIHNYLAIRCTKCEFSSVVSRNSRPSCPRQRKLPATYCPDEQLFNIQPPAVASTQHDIAQIRSKLPEHVCPDRANLRGPKLTRRMALNPCFSYKTIGCDHSDVLRYRKNTVIITSEIAKGLFKGTDPVNKEMRIGQYTFRVAGVMEKLGGSTFGGPNLDRQVYIPVSTFAKNFGGRRFQDVDIAVKAPSMQSLEDLEYQVIGEMRRIRGLRPSANDNLSINKLDSLLGAFNSIVGAILGIGILVTSISLFVGGIGVLNNMFVSVTERSLEISIRKAMRHARMLYSPQDYTRLNAALWTPSRRCANSSWRPSSCAISGTSSSDSATRSSNSACSPRPRHLASFRSPHFATIRTDVVDSEIGDLQTRGAEGGIALYIVEQFLVCLSFSLNVRPLAAHSGGQDRAGGNHPLTDNCRLGYLSARDHRGRSLAHIRCFEFFNAFKIFHRIVLGEYVVAARLLCLNGFGGLNGLRILSEFRSLIGFRSAWFRTGGRARRDSEQNRN